MSAIYHGTRECYPHAFVLTDDDPNNDVFPNVHMVLRNSQFTLAGDRDTVTMLRTIATELELALDVRDTALARKAS